MRYLSGFFALDFVSTVPWDLVMTNEALGLVQLFKVSRIVKLVRIMRILKLIRILRLLKVCSGSGACITSYTVMLCTMDRRS